MKNSKFSESQVAFILRQTEEGASIGEVCRKAGNSEATFYVWRKKYSALMPSEMRRLKQLEAENARLKRIVADLSLDKEILEDVIRRKCRTCPAPPARRSYASAWQVRIRRAYAALQAPPHSAIGDKCPIELMNGVGPYGPPDA